MKARIILSWLIKGCVNTDGMGTVSVDEDFDYKMYFGFEPISTIPSGDYVYLYSDTVPESLVEKLTEETGEQPYFIFTDSEDHENGGLTAIYLFKLED